MKPSTLVPIIALMLAAACTTPRPLVSNVDLSGMPPDLPRSAIADLDPDAQRKLQRGLTRIDRQMSDVCSAEERQLIKEGLVLFGWATASTIPNPPMQAYAERRGPELRAARQTLQPACGARLDALVEEIRSAQP